MALSTEEFAQINQIVTQANEAQFDRLSEKLELTAKPIQDNLQHHTAHDEKIHEDMYNKLGDLSTGQASLKMGMKMVSVFGGVLLTVATGVLTSVIKGWV